MSDPAVCLRDVFCVHRTPDGDAAALQGLSFALARGERACVIGPSGAGKTTLLRVIAGLQTPAAGSVLVFGDDPGRMSGPARARLRRHAIGFLDQHAQDALSPDLTAAESIALPLALRGISRAQARVRVKALLAAAELSDRAGARPAELAGGECQRVALCAALAHRPALLLADEPTAELDERTAALTAAVIDAMARTEGTTVLSVSHDPALAEAAQRTLRIRDGRIVEERAGGDPALVVGRGGWVRLPRALREAAQIGGAVRAVAAGETIVLRSVPAAARPSSPSDATPAEPGRGQMSGAGEPGGLAAPEHPVEVCLVGVTRGRGRGRARRVVLAGLSTCFTPGALTAVTGPSGSGKTTLLELLAGLDCADQGQVLLDGVDLGDLGAEPRAALRRGRIGYLTQAPAPVGFLSAAENVVLALRLRGVADGPAGVRAVAILNGLGLGERVAQRVARLSAGEAQRVALASALAGTRGLLLVDEPTSRLDRRAAVLVARALSAAAAAGHTVICATHDEELIGACSHRLRLEAQAATEPSTPPPTPAPR